MKIVRLLFAAMFVLPMASTNAQSPTYSIKSLMIGSTGGWDYLAVSPVKPWVYVSNGNKVNVIDKLTGDSVAVISNTPGIHGICFDVARQQGFTSNGRANTVTVFNLNDNRTKWQISVGKNPDAIIYEPFLKKIITCNGGGKNLSIIDPSSRKTVDSVAVGGKPEEAASDGHGKIYVNLEDKNQVAVVDLRTFKTINHWSLMGAEGPTGLAIDRKTHRLFVACEKILVVMNADNGKIIVKIPIGDGCDGVAFDESTRNIFTSNGEGTMSVIHEENAGTFKLIETVPTKRSARTIALDPATHAVYMSAADLEPLAPGEKGWPKIKAGSFQVLLLNKK